MNDEDEIEYELDENGDPILPHFDGDFDESDDIRDR